MASSTSLTGKEKVQRMIVIRHAEDAGNTQTDRPYYDPPLTECGLQQATEAGKRFIDKVKYIIPNPELVEATATWYTSAICQSTFRRSTTSSRHLFSDAYRLHSKYVKSSVFRVSTHVMI